MEKDTNENEKYCKKIYLKKTKNIHAILSEEEGKKSKRKSSHTKKAAKQKKL